MRASGLGGYTSYECIITRMDGKGCGLKASELVQAVKY